ncbi:MAG: type secretion periplasmic lipoprotein [Chlamydiota bacterium]|jgi:type III secretion protein J
MRRFIHLLTLCILTLLATGCESNKSIVNNIDEREANEIVVYLASRGIDAQKVQGATSEIGGAGAHAMFNITVASDREVDAMAALNRVGLPRRQGTNLLELFAKSGLMSSDREETIRYQAGLAEELRNTIRKIDGVIDADVQLSFPPAEALSTPGAVVPKTTAAVYVKHQGVLEDPNSHIEVKIKRLLAGSVNGLDYDNVAVISDRSRFSDISLVSGADGEIIGSQAAQQTYVSIWGLVMTKSSLTRFRILFFTFILLLLLISAALGWILYKFYPLMRTQMKQSEEPLLPPTS